jgi:hypothetical protein
VRIFNSGNSCYHSVQNLLSYRLLYEHLQIINFCPLICMDAKFVFLILKKEHRVMVFKNRVPRRIFG